jgi:hypothetical protein
VNTNNLVSLLSHDEVNHYLASGLGAAYGLEVQMRLLKEGLPYDECQALLVDLDNVAPERQVQQKLVKELSGRPHPYRVAAFGYSLEDEQVRDLQTAGVHVFQHGLDQAVFAWIAEQSSDGPSGALAGHRPDTMTTAHHFCHQADIIGEGASTWPRS